MTRALNELGRVESRVLGALRFIDSATAVPIEAPLRIVAPADILRNRSGLYVVRRYAPLANHADSFTAPPGPPPAVGDLTLSLDVHDPAGIYLSRTAGISLPRDPLPANAGNPDSLFRPVEVELYRSPAAPLGAYWAALRVSLTETDTRDALAGALLRVRVNGRILARGLTDWRGEALVPVVGVPITTWSDDEDAVIVSEIEATLEVFFDAAAGGSRTAADRLAAGRPPADAPVPDPALAEAGAVRTQAAIRLATGRPLNLSLTLDLPG